jgi:hypothetical protein
MPEDNRSAPPISVQLAITQLLVIGLTALAVRWQLDSKTTSDNVYALASALTAILIAAWNGLQTHLNAQRAKKAETLAPGLAKLQIPEGKEVIVTTAINDPNTPDPPTVISETTTKSSDIPEVRPMKAIKLLLFSMVGMIVMICGLSGCAGQANPDTLAASQRLSADLKATGDSLTAVKQEIAATKATLAATTQAAATQPGGQVLIKPIEQLTQKLDKAADPINKAATVVTAAQPVVDAINKAAVADPADQKVAIQQAITEGVKAGLTIQHTVAPQYDAQAALVTTLASLAVGLTVGVGGLIAGHKTAAKAITTPGTTTTPPAAP